MVEENIEKKGSRKKREGVVVKASLPKTRVVKVTRLMQHPHYKKTVKIAKKYYVHDEENTSKVGDKVRIIESKPYSKLKRWKLVEVISS
jgi:small subunit ribosomal protein S17